MIEFVFVGSSESISPVTIMVLWIIANELPIKLYEFGTAIIRTDFIKLWPCDLWIKIIISLVQSLEHAYEYEE